MRRSVKQVAAMQSVGLGWEERREEIPREVQARYHSMRAGRFQDMSLKDGIGWTSDSQARPVQNVCVDHRGAHVAMAEQIRVTGS